MSPSMRGQDSFECWNCDSSLDRTTDLKLQIPSGDLAILTLCGACFRTAYLPIAADAKELSVGGTILVIEDDPSMRGLLETVLVTEGYQVDSASNGAEALKKVRDKIPDAIVLDLRMPEMSGQEFLRAWRQSAPKPTVPVIAISAHYSTVTAAELGVNSFLPKPFEYATFVGTVAALVGAGASAPGSLGGAGHNP